MILLIVYLKIKKHCHHADFSDVKDLFTNVQDLSGYCRMVLSRTALQHLIDNESCRCASDDAPDDMTLGLCLKHVGIAVTHSPLFHQARPNDYSELYLANQDPVTFHKHWNVNPYEVYNKYLDVVSTPDDTVRDEL